MTRFVAVDLGGTQIRAALYRPTGQREARAALPTQAHEGPEAVLNRIKEAVREVWPTEEEVTALTVAAPGPLDSKRGVVIFAPNLPGWENLPLRDRLAETFGVRTIVANDANLAALGEHRFGAGQEVDNMVYLTISTGIGGGVILDGRLFEGGQGLGGEVGHIVVEANGPGPRCSCGSDGCLETLAAGPAIARAARAALEAGEPSSLPERVAGKLERITAKEVAEAARAGDALSKRAIARAGFYIGTALSTLMHLLNPDLFIIGGSVAKAGDLLFGPMRDQVRACTAKVYWRNTPILPAALGDDVGLMGALALALERTGG